MTHSVRPKRWTYATGIIIGGLFTIAGLIGMAFNDMAWVVSVAGLMTLIPNTFMFMLQPSTHGTVDTQQESVESRLTKLQDLHNKGLITPDEYHTQKNQILAEL